MDKRENFMQSKIDNFLKFTNLIILVFFCCSVTYNVGFFWPDIPYDYLTILDISFSGLFLIPCFLIYALLFILYVPKEWLKIKLIKERSRIRIIMDKLFGFLGLIYIFIIYSLHYRLDPAYILVAILCIVNAVQSIYTDRKFVPRLLVITYIIFCILLGYFDRERNNKRVLIILQDNTVQEGILMRNLNKGILLNKNSRSILFINWDQVKIVETKI